MHPFHERSATKRDRAELQVRVPDKSTKGEPPGAETELGFSSRKQHCSSNSER